MASQAAAKPESKNTTPSISILRPGPNSGMSRIPTLTRPGLTKSLPRTLPSAAPVESTDTQEESTENVEPIPNPTSPTTTSSKPISVFRNLLGQTVEPTKTVKSESTSERSRCTSCEREFATKTLANYGGVCGRCSKAKPASDTSKTQAKGPCANCKKEFTLKTLDKCKGVCGKCNNKLQSGSNPSTTTVSSKKVSEKAMCSGPCGKEYTQKTLEKHGGMCNRCMSKSTGGRVTPPRVSPLLSDPNKSMGSILATMQSFKSKSQT